MKNKKKKALTKPPWETPPSHPLMMPGPLRQGYYGRQLAARQVNDEAKATPAARPPCAPEIAPEMDSRIVPGERWAAYYRTKQRRTALESASRTAAAMDLANVDPRYVDPPTFSD